MSKVAYRELCNSEDSIPLFSRAWWLDATAGCNNWNVVNVMNGQEIIATMPYIYQKRFGFNILTQPVLTQSLGPWFKHGSIKSTNQLTFHKKVMQSLIDQLPPFDHFHQNWSLTLTNWLPFYWNGFKQTTRYSYVLNDLTNIEIVWKNFNDNIKWEIKKAKNRYKLNVRNDLGIDEFIILNDKTFGRQGLRTPYSAQFIKNLDTACQKNNARKIFIAEDEKGRFHAGVYLVWDENSAYYLMGGADPLLRKSGATSLCIWEAIQFAATVTKRFDFEGSMLEPVERFIRSFGPTQTPYFAITKSPSKLVKLAIFFREILRRD
jgi:hypothetical protein